ncbi:hypothetical protein I3J19_00045 [Streptomyces clavuligerus]|nr:hypothetical protein I3J19_00045 [Streptomyces clavuligerus]
MPRSAEGFAEVGAEDVFEEGDAEEFGEEQIGLVADGPVVDLDDPGAARVDDELGVAGAEADAEGVERVEHLGDDGFGVGGDECHALLDEVRERGEFGAEAAEDMAGAAVAQGLQGVQVAGEVLLGDEGGAGAAGADGCGVPQIVLGALHPDDVLAGDPFARFEHPGEGKAAAEEFGGLLTGRQFEAAYGVGGEAAAHLGLVLGREGGSPVLAGEAEPLGGQGGLGLEVVAVAEDGVRAPMGGDSADDGVEVAYVAVEDLHTGVVFAIPVAVCGGLVGQQGDREAEPVGRREEPVGDRVGGVVGEHIHLHG